MQSMFFKLRVKAKVWDGSEGQVGQGYWINSVVVADVDKEQLVPLYNELFSQKAKDFGSENQQIFKALRAIHEQLKGKGIWAMDRGADRKKIVEELGGLKSRFVIRPRGDRKVETKMGRRIEIREIANRAKTETKHKITIDKEGYKEDKEICLGIRHGIQVEGVTVSIVVVRGFGKNH